MKRRFNPAGITVYQEFACVAAKLPQKYFLFGGSQTITLITRDTILKFLHNSLISVTLELCLSIEVVRFIGVALIILRVHLSDFIMDIKGH